MYRYKTDKHNKILNPYSLAPLSRSNRRCFKKMVSGHKRVTELPQDRESLFRGWFNNHVTILLMAIERVSLSSSRVRRLSQRSAAKALFFLEDVERHYQTTKSRRSARHAFRYLTTYFKLYPEVSRRQSKKAIEMVGRVYESVGLRFDYRGHRKLGPLKRPTYLEVAGNLDSVFGPLKASAVNC